MKSNLPKVLATTIKAEDFPRIGFKLREVRNELGYTLPEVSTSIGKSRLQLINYEKGRQMTTAALLALAKLYGRPVADFLPDEYK